MPKVTRRSVLSLGAAAAVGAVAGGVGVGAVMSARQQPAAQPSTKPRATFEAWRSTRRAPYYIAHRGAGDVVPEHTVPGYQTALDWAAECIELSVVMSADNVLYCLHDLTLDRTTTLRGAADTQPAAILDTAKVTVPRLGPRWVGANMPALPRFSDVLAAVGGKAVLCIEPKNDSAYPLLMEAIEEANCKDSAIIKLDGSSQRVEMAKQAGYPVFAYLGNPEVASVANIDSLAKRLDPERDCMVLPARDDNGLFSPDVIRHAVDTGIPVWVFPVHRRYEVKHFSRLGVEGIVTPDLAYQSSASPPRKVDDWASGGISPGELTREPYSDTYGLTWGEEGVIGLDFTDRPSFLTLGQFCPITADSYRIAFDVNFDPLPKDTWQHVSVAFGHADDRYYEHRLGAGDGYHVLLRADGGMGIFAHVEGDPNGQELTAPTQSTPLKPGVWSRLTLDVTPDLIRWSRDDGTSMEIRDSRFRGGYIHIGRSAVDGPLNVRGMSIA